jgi:hypothetical protein
VTVTKIALILSIAGLLGLSFSATATAGAIPGASASTANASHIMAIQEKPAPTPKHFEPCGPYGMNSHTQCCSGNKTYTVGQIIYANKTALKCANNIGVTPLNHARWLVTVGQ